MSQHELDARGLLCPLPVIKVQNTVKTLAVGDELRVYCTDPGTLHDIPSWCRIYGHTILSTQQDDTGITLIVQVGNTQ